MWDVAIVGGGIVGIATAWRLQARYPRLSVIVLEKEDDLAFHQTGRNSGVIHAGIYYEPGSLKALFCKAGLSATIGFCDENDIRYEQCGKLIVATGEDERGRLMSLAERATANGLVTELLNAKELVEREPRIVGVAALLSPSTGIVDYGRIVRRMAEIVAARGGDIRTGCEVRNIAEEASEMTLVTSLGDIRCRHLICCGGAQADRLARMSGIATDFRIVPFRGEYFALPEEKQDIISRLIYPVPNPALPFLGIHLTRMISGAVTVGPNAVLSLAREGYSRFTMNCADMKEMISFPGFWKLMRRYAHTGVAELAGSTFRHLYLRKCRAYCPELTLEDLQPFPAGIRAQAVMADGTLAHDFLIRETPRSVHVCNAPSPAATSAIPIADYIVDAAKLRFQWPG